MPILPPPEDYTTKGWVAPTVYKKAGLTITSGWNYYYTLNQAIYKYLFLSNLGGANIEPAGMVTFPNGTTAQTMGINVDFYKLVSGSWYPTDYSYLRSAISLPPVVFRFYTTQGDGPFYAIFDPNVFGMAATTINDVDPDKLVQLDLFYREVQLLKYRYNNLVGFLNNLALKTLTPSEQQIFNEGVLRLQNMQAQISQLDGIEITYTSQGAIGNPILLIILIILILSAATAWTISNIVSMKEKTKQINDSYNLSMWVATKKQEIAQQVTAGQISQANADGIYKNLDTAQKAADKVAENASKGNGLFDNIESIVKWGVIGFIAIEGSKLLREKRTANG